MDVARWAVSDDEQRLLVIYAIQRLLALAPDERTLLRESCALLARYRHYRLVCVRSVEADGAAPIIASAGVAEAYLDGVNARWDGTPEGKGNVGWVVRHGQPCVTRTDDPLFNPWRARAESFGIASLLTLPLRIERAVIGTITAYSDEIGGFEDKERRLLEGLVGDIERSVHLLRIRAATERETQRSADRLRRLEALRRLFASSDGEIDARRTVLLGEGARSLGLDVGAVGTVEGTVLHYQVFSVNEPPREPLRAVPLEGSLATHALREGRTRSWSDLAGDATLIASNTLLGLGYRSAIITPFEIGGRRYALLFAGRYPRGTPFQEEDHLYVELLASSFAQFVRQSEQQEQIEHLRAFDQLTGLPNRASLEARLAELVRARDAAARTFAVLGVDLDRFRGVNTALGFAVGDRLLVESARRLRELAHDDDLVARLGGDAFGIVAETLTPDEALELARNTCNALNVPIHIDGHEVILSASVGVALYPTDATDATELLACATSAIASVRSEGGGSYQFYSKEIGRRVEAKRHFHRDVIRAREENEFRLYFQPEIDLRSGKVVGAEALLRWHDAESGVRPAATFIPLAEETGLISWLDRWALRSAVEQVQRWERARNGLFVACNLSGHSVLEPELLGELRELIMRSGIDPACLQIELTETVAMRDVAATSSFLHACRALGISVALDDFGTGYSSLMHLKRLPVDAIKIDGSFVRGLPHSEEDNAIVRATIALGHSLGRRIVAECVEQEHQAHWLAELGCDLAQGHWYGEAMPAEDFEARLDAW